MKQSILIAVVAFIAGGVLVYRYMPQIKTETVTKDHIVTRTRVVTRPDGTTETDTTKTEDKEKKKESVVQTKAPDWHISAGAAIDKSLIPSYRAQVERRILGPIFIGINGSTRGEVGGVVGFEF